jgi:hypothetical protein
MAMMVVVLAVGGCRSPSGRPAPEVSFDQVPEAAAGGARDTAAIAGRVSGAAPGQRIVLYTRTEGWWVQPLASNPYTEIKPDATWANTTHLGAEYAALVVDPGYEPPPRADTLPPVGGGVVSVATMAGRPSRAASVKTLHFSGYDWTVREAPSDRGGVSNEYDAGNVALEAAGALRLRIAGTSPGWTCAEVALTRSRAAPWRASRSTHVSSAAGRS